MYKRQAGGGGTVELKVVSLTRLLNSQGILQGTRGMRFHFIRATNAEGALLATNISCATNGEKYVRRIAVDVANKRVRRCTAHEFASHCCDRNSITCLRLPEQKRRLLDERASNACDGSGIIVPNVSEAPFEQLCF